MVMRDTGFQSQDKDFSGGVDPANNRVVYHEMSQLGGTIYFKILQPRQTEDQTRDSSLSGLQKPQCSYVGGWGIWWSKND